MATKDDGGPIHPSNGSFGPGVKSGMSLRDWFAGQAPVNWEMACGAAKITGQVISFSDRPKVWEAMATSNRRIRFYATAPRRNGGNEEWHTV